MPTMRAKPRVGLIVPSVQVVTEPLFYEAAGEQFDFFTTRLHLAGSGAEALRAMDASIPRAVQELADAGVDAMALCCTGSGAVSGTEAELDLCRRVTEDTGIPMVTTMLSVVDALRHVGAGSVVIASPYPDEMNRIERAYLERLGLRVLAEAGQGIRHGLAYAEVTPAEIVEFALDHWDQRADALFLSCMNWQAMRAAGSLEATIGRPVITSHNATLWNVARRLDRRGDWRAYGSWLSAEVGSEVGRDPAPGRPGGSQ